MILLNISFMLLYFYDLCNCRVPQSVLRLKFSMVCKVFLDILAANSATSTASLLRSALSCLSTVLRVQEAAVWGEPSTLQAYQGLLVFTIHQKPKVSQGSLHLSIMHFDMNLKICQNHVSCRSFDC